MDKTLTAMKKSLSLFFAGATIIALMAACDKDNSPNDPIDQGNDPLPDPIEATFAEYSLEGTSSAWANLDYGDRESLLMVINSDEILSNHICGKDYPQIDFSKKTLLFAYGVEGYQNAPNDVKFRQTPSGDYMVTINLRPSLAAAMLEWRVAIVVDKLSDKDKVGLSITRE